MSRNSSIYVIAILFILPLALLVVVKPISIDRSLPVFARFFSLLGLTSLPHASTDGSRCCDLLQRVGIGHILSPGSANYSDRVSSYWSLTSQLSPACFVQPSSTAEVSAVVKTLANQPQCEFVIRSGGHSWNAGTNNLEGGVTIDLGRMNTTEYNPTTELASLLPGARWLDVYRTLDAVGRGVQGGVIGTVGVGGLLLGGGLSPYLFERGFAMDDIYRMEVVLANGDIIEASAEENSDLYQVLKGAGASGFGIVTRYDMRTFPVATHWSAFREYPENSDANSAHIRGLKHWTDNPEAYQSGSAIIFWTYRPKINRTIIISAVDDTAGQAEPPALKEFLSIPGYESSQIGYTNMSTSALVTQAEGYRNIWFTITFKNDEKVISKAVSVHQELVEYMQKVSSDGDFETMCYFQALPSIVGQRGAQKGGNILGIENMEDNAVILLGTLAVNGVDQEAHGRRKMLEWKDEIEEFSKSVGAFVEYRYINYADASQNVMASYGKESVKKMLAVSKKYDPDGLFQKRSPVGFKLPLYSDEAKEL